MHWYSFWIWWSLRKHQHLEIQLQNKNGNVIEHRNFTYLVTWCNCNIFVYLLLPQDLLLLFRPDDFQCTDRVPYVKPLWGKFYYTVPKLTYIVQLCQWVFYHEIKIQIIFVLLLLLLKISKLLWVHAGDDFDTAFFILIEFGIGN